MHKPKNIFGPDPDPKNSPLGPKRAQNDPKKAKDQKVNKQKKNFTKLKLSVHMSKPQKHFSDLMATQHSPIGPKRAQNYPSKRQKFKK